MLTITKRYHAECGHYLPKVHDDHKCKRQHGHNYVFEVTIEGSRNDVGFVIDFWDLDKIVQPIIDLIDHRNLNDIVGLENPTAENIAIWFAKKIKKDLPKSLHLYTIVVYETPDCWATYMG